MAKPVIFAVFLLLVSASRFSVLALFFLFFNFFKCWELFNRAKRTPVGCNSVIQRH